MRIGHVVAVMAIFGLTSIAWVTLGGSTSMRSQKQGYRLSQSVSELWGRPQRQRAPKLVFEWVTFREALRTERVDGKDKVIRETVRESHEREVTPASTDVDVGLRLDQRLKGLVWYSLYDVAFAGKWSYEHREAQDGFLRVELDFPDAEGLYDDLRFVVDGQDRARAMVPDKGKVTTRVPVSAGQTIALGVSYKSRGASEWRYAPAESVASLERFRVGLQTDFSDIDFPSATLSPSSKEHLGKGMRLEWRFARVVTGHGIGMKMPERIQPGELASALSFSAPISLLFFFFLLMVLGTIKRIELHPMHYVFVAASFFAFHLLFAYVVDRVSVGWAFGLSSAVSVALVVSYLRVVVSARFALVEAALGQIVYLVGFSLAHFWEGYTGLTLTLLSIGTLGLLMQLTARVRWGAVLGAAPPALPPLDPAMPPNRPTEPPPAVA